MRYITPISIIVLIIIGFIVLINKAEQPIYEEPVFESDPFVRDDPFGERNDEYDCSDFSSHDEAQEIFEEAGGPDEDYYNLDRNGDGVACESLL